MVDDTHNDEIIDQIGYIFCSETLILCWVPLRRLQERQDGGVAQGNSPCLPFLPKAPIYSLPHQSESHPGALHLLNSSQPGSSLSVGNSETLDLPSMATTIGEYID